MNEYLEKMIAVLDFESINQFLNEHMRMKMSFEEIVKQVSVHGIEVLSKETISQMFYDAILYEISVVRPIFLKILSFSILFSIIQRLMVSKKTYVSNIGFLLIYTTLMVLLMQSFLIVSDIARDGVDGMLAFLNALIPTYTTTMIFTGNAVSGVMAYELVLFLIYFVAFFMRNFLSPFIHVFVLVLFLNHLFEEDKLSKLAEIMENMIGWILKLSIASVVGLSVVQSLLTPVKDRLLNLMKLTGVSSIPGIGEVLGSSGEILLSCGMLIKNSVGIVGLIILLIITINPIVKIGCYCGMYRILAIILQPVADKRLVECVCGVARGCDLYFKIILYAMVLFFLLISIITMATNLAF